MRYRSLEDCSQKVHLLGGHVAVRPENFGVLWLHRCPKKDRQDWTELRITAPLTGSIDDDKLTSQGVVACGDCPKAGRIIRMEWHDVRPEA